MTNNPAVKQGAVLYEGKAKRLSQTSDPQVLWVEFLDQATAFNGVKKDTIPGKGNLNAEISAKLFRYLDSRGIPSHYLSSPAAGEHLVRKVEIIPLEVVVRNIAAGSLCARLGVEEGRILDEPIVEFFYKDDALGDPLLNNEHIRLLNLARDEELKQVRNQALAVNEALRELFAKVGVDLVDFKLEFGRTGDGEILLADEISPDNCRLWEVEGKTKLDKDVYRADLGDLVPVYERVNDMLETVLGREGTAVE